MKVLLLAAGMGSRLRPITDTIPKCMVPIDGRPLLDYWFELLADRVDVEEIIINTHYLPEPVRDYVTSSPHVGKVTLIHEAELQGTGGTILALIDKLKGHQVLVCHADNLTLFSVDDFVRAHNTRPEGCTATMMTFVTDSPKNCGILELDKRGVVLNMHEKVQNPPSDLANAAVFIFSPEFLDTIQRKMKLTFAEVSTDFLPLFFGQIYTFHNEIYHRDIGTPTALELAQHEWPAIYKNFKKRKKLT